MDAVAGRPIGCLGAADVEREIAFVADAMRTVADLAEREEAYGTDWGIPGNGTASPWDLARIAGEHLGREVTVRAVPPWAVRLLALLIPSLRPAVPLAPHYSRPVRYDTAKLRGLLGEVERTPIPEAVGTTLDWLAERNGRRRQRA
jgi:nucleoside-diphosphate-sugar epimerase